MTGELYYKWRDGKRKYLIKIGYSKDMVEYIVNWFNGIKGKYEIELIEKYIDNADMIIKTRKELFNLYSSADKTNWLNFDLIFSLYTPLLVLEFNKVNNDK